MGLRLRKGSAGFTLVELVLVILILGILAVTAIPKFLDLQEKAYEASHKGVAGSVRGGIAIFHASALLNNTTPAWPATLDNHTAPITASTTDLFFSLVLEPGVDDVRWSKTAATTYVYTYGASSVTYTYTNSDGSFK